MQELATGHCANTLDSTLGKEVNDERGMAEGSYSSRMARWVGLQIFLETLKKE